MEKTLGGQVYNHRRVYTSFQHLRKSLCEMRHAGWKGRVP